MADMQAVLDNLVVDVAPHRPRKAIYESVLSDESFASRFALLQTLGRPSDAAGIRASHSVVRTSYGHTGCVNALDWQPETARLATGSDDTKICIWAPGLDRHSSADAQVSHPRLGYGLEQAIDTGHVANIFSVKWAPGMQDRLFSCAGDATVRVYDIGDPVTASSVSHPTGKTWMHHEQSACIRTFRCHEDRVKRVATETSPDVFLTCAEDGQVRSHDVRTEHTCSRGECGPPLLEYPGLSLYSLSISKARPHLFVVAGTSRHAFLHDRRMMRTPMLRDWNIEMKNGRSTQCVRRFGLPKEDGTGEVERHVVATKLSDSNGRDLLVSYSSDAVYLFDIDDDPHVPPERIQVGADTEASAPTPKRTRSNASTPGQNKRRRDSQERQAAPETSIETNTEAERFKPESPLSISSEMLEPADDDDDDEDSDDSGDSGEEILIEDSDDDADGDDTEGEDPSEAFLPRRLRRERPTFDADVPLIAPVRSYKGHANSETVKDVNFLFQDSLVVSGSDDGNWFVWSKDSGELLGIYAGDSSVVNVMEGHPTLPVVAVSGIDETIKLFGPTTDASKMANLIQQADEIKTRNATSQPRRFGIPRQALLEFLASQLQGQEGGVGGRSVVVHGPEGEEQECTVS